MNRGCGLGVFMIIANLLSLALAIASLATPGWIIVSGPIGLWQICSSSGCEAGTEQLVGAVQAFMIIACIVLAIAVIFSFKLAIDGTTKPAAQRVAYIVAGAAAFLNIAMALSSIMGTYYGYSYYLGWASSIMCLIAELGFACRFYKKS